MKAKKRTGLFLPETPAPGGRYRTEKASPSLNGRRIISTMATHPLTIEADQQTALEQLALQQSCSPEVLVRRAIDRLLIRERYLHDGEESYRHYKETGLHLTHDEVDAWLAKLESGEDAELPECHV